VSTVTTIPLSIPGLDESLRLQVHDSRDKVISQRLRETGIWEPFETSLLLDLLQPGDVFVDVGANLGYFTVLAAARVGDHGRVFAFEPDPDNFALLQANCLANGVDQRVCAVHGALAQHDGRGTLYLSEDNLGDHQIFDISGTRRSHSISLLNGGDYLGPRTLRVDLLKIDTQGSEYAVVAGLLSYLQKLDAPPQIIVELTPLSLRQAGASGRELIDCLAQLEQPFWIVDHIEHVLAATSAEELAVWCDNVDGCPGDEGFMNILVGQGIASA